MDKTMKRKIGYVAPAKEIKNKAVRTVVIVSKPDGSIQIPAKVAKAMINSPLCAPAPTPEGVITWIKDHPLFKWSGMCRQIGIDAPNFSRTLTSEVPVIEPENLSKIVQIIESYGFVPGRAQTATKVLKSEKK